MPDFLVSAATGALSPVLNKLAALLGDEYKRFKGVRGEVKFLIRELEAMHAFLLKKSEDENPDAQDKAWMKEVRELSYDIEDSLDDFRVRVDDDSTKPDGFIDKCKNLLDKTKARRRIAKEIEKLKGQVKEVSERNARYKQIGENIINTSKVPVDPRALAIFEDASKLVGIDRPKEEVISFLMKDDGGVSLQQPKIVSIVGIGGIGKTTLANRVYEELKDQFECRVFLSVSRNPDIFKILRTILSKVTGRVCNETDIQQLIMEIKDFLQTKRYFIVVDDVWDVETWDTIKYALSDNGYGSAIITTTRVHDVAKACCLLYSGGWVYKPKPLPEHDSKRLFHNRIFGPSNECPENLEEVSSKILKKCGGLPLAIIAISGLLANKARNGVHSVTEWDQVQTSIGRGLERDSTVKGMMRILSLSYFDLPHHLKACLLYLSIFPEDYDIEKKRLVLLWVAEGFIPAESTCTLYESGKKAFNQLVNRNLIHPKEIQKWTGEVESCYLHDTILDFIVCKSVEENFVTVHGIPRLTLAPGIKVRRLSLQGITDGDVTLHLNQIYANVRSIISFGFPCSLLGFRFLRVLDFTGTFLLENHHLANIGELLQLRYLSLRDTSITELPEQIGMLRYLETLDLRDTYIKQLPTAIVRLKRLVNLKTGPQLVVCSHGVIKNLQALEALEFHIKAAAVFFEEIGYLTKMRHLNVSFHFEYWPIDIDEDLLKKMVSSFQRLNKLQSLFIELYYDKEEYSTVLFIADDAIPDVPWFSGSLRKFVFMMTLSRVPSWMKSLVNIEKLELSIKKLDQESLCILGDLPVLADLTLETVNIEGIPSTDKQRLLVSNRHGYRNLRHFSVEAESSSYPSIPMLTFEAGSVPKLVQLRVHFDADITIFVSNGRLDFGLNHLSQLTEVQCDIVGTKLSIWRVQNAIKKALGNHPKLPSFGYTGLPFRFPLPEGERSNREHIRPRRRSQSRVHTTQPKPSSIADLLEQEVIQEPAHDVVICTSGSHDKMSSSATDDNTGAGQSLTAALPLPTDLSFTINHCGASPEHGGQHGQRQRRSKARQGASISGRQLVQGAPIIPNRVKGTSGAAPGTSDVLGPRLIANPQQQGAFVPPCFTFSSRSLSNAGPQQRTMDSYELSQHEDLANAFSSALDGLSLGDDHAGSSAAAVETAFLETGASPTSDVLGPPVIAVPQQQEAFVPPCFTFGSRSPPNTEAEQQAMDGYMRLQHDDLANTFSSAFNGLSLHNEHHGSTATVVEVSSGTACESTTIRGRELVLDAPVIPDCVTGTSGAVPVTSDVLGPRLIASQQKGALVPPCFMFSSRSPPNAEPEQAKDYNKPSQHDDHPGSNSNATAVETASSDTGAVPVTSDILGPRLIASQQKGALVPPCFMFSSRSPPNAEPEQAKDYNKPSQHDDHPGSNSNATGVETASSDTGSSSFQGGGCQEEQ